MGTVVKNNHNKL